MRWIVEDMEKYEGAKDFIDTALIPVFSFEINQVGKQVVQEQKWLEEICVYTERQLTGRLILFPTLYLLQGDWSPGRIQTDPFTHCLFVTTNTIIYENLIQSNRDAYLLERNDQEDELNVMVREGKRLTKKIMESWQK